MLLQCEWATIVWYGLKIGYKVDKQRITSFDKWFEHVCNMGELKDYMKRRIRTAVPIVCRIIWKERCNLVFKNKAIDPKGCIEKINGVVGEILQAKGMDKNRIVEGRRDKNERWMKLDPGWVKVNCDGACDMDKKEGEESWNWSCD